MKFEGQLNPPLADELPRFRVEDQHPTAIIRDDHALLLKAHTEHRAAVELHLEAELLIAQIPHAYATMPRIETTERAKRAGFVDGDTWKNAIRRPVAKKGPRVLMRSSHSRDKRLREVVFRPTHERSIRGKADVWPRSILVG